MVLSFLVRYSLARLFVVPLLFSLYYLFFAHLSLARLSLSLCLLFLVLFIAHLSFAFLYCYYRSSLFYRSSLIIILRSLLAHSIILIAPRSFIIRSSLYSPFTCFLFIVHRSFHSLFSFLYWLFFVYRSSLFYRSSLLLIVVFFYSLIALLITRYSLVLTIALRYY